jgi:hypothetical protein
MSQEKTRFEEQIEMFFASNHKIKIELFVIILPKSKSL